MYILLTINTTWRSKALKHTVVGSLAIIMHFDMKKYLLPSFLGRGENGIKRTGIYKAISFGSIPPPQDASHQQIMKHV